MDTAEQLLKQEGLPVPDNFVVAGLSKVNYLDDCLYYSKKFSIE